ncbi:MAG: thiamine-phosphate kinase [Thauera propionica]|jgi:thiamine-monophosphate kinase|uniref:Thiamine-monophosphate kinase n=1 Tax=Thauera propionica TaxID=2019431 RepID=A0A235F1N8_9RHOO|nr:thiamine-phosphate kinase [Thauera propionica]MDY0046616.1 thiamine-phosphate kinase [Thauera propionica]OYD55208.1 thiamine-phosphate kinase [Thauera propionica]
MPSEFDLIRRHFTRSPQHTDLAVGDDAALLRPRAGVQLAVSTDMLVSGTHFFADTDPEDLGWKTLAVNVSDLAAMGAEPRWAFLALALPAADDPWIAAFARGLFACADAFGVDLAGGDTTRGPLNLSVTIVGEVPAGQAITRTGARAGNELWISGQPGLAALGLAALHGEVALDAAGRARCVDALQRPQPRVELGLQLRGIATAMLDVSDGLLGDLAHILEASAVGAIVDAAALPLDALRATGANAAIARRCLLSGGDDYELLFAAPASARPALTELSTSLGLPLHRIGQITGQAGVCLLREPDGTLAPAGASGYDHFA